jgi:predicted 2-oxoglutarate/Fe(II)-dependent dioxygenase YbiX
MTDATPLSPGDRLPFAYGMDAGQSYWSFEDQAGRPSVLLPTADATPAELSEIVAALAARCGAFGARGAGVCVLATVGLAGWATARLPDGVRLMHVMDLALASALGGEPCLAVADRAMRLVERIRLDAGPGPAVDAALAALDRLAAEPVAPAPVLYAPRVISPGLCARLIAAFEAGAHVEGAMASVDADGRAISRIDAGKKHRRDLQLAPGDPLHGDVVAALCARLLPEMAKAFHARPTQLDRILVARYDDTGGYFRRHRDNSSAHLAYREFALSLNLNTGDYDGGELVFPEFEDRRHSPPAGGAVVFSASLLHEALPVTRGRRYVLLTFLHGEAAEARRQAAALAGESVTEPA